MVKKINNRFIVIIVSILVVIGLIGIVFISLNPFDNTCENCSDNSVDFKYIQSPFLWKIEGDNPSYLFGSIHLGDRFLLTMPSVVIDSLKEVDNFYTETKLDSDTLDKVMNYSYLPTGTSIVDLLPDDVEQRLDDYLKSKGFSLSIFSQFKVWAVTSNLGLLGELFNLSLYPQVDKYLWNIADQLGKNLDGIETIQEQIEIFDTMTIDEQLYLLNDTLDYVEEQENQGIDHVSELKNAYLSGDLRVLDEILNEDIDLSDPFDVELLNDILINRNYNMSSRIVDLIENNPDEQFFFVIGSGHFYGDEGIISLIEEQGFEITRVSFSESSECANGELIDNKCYIPYN